MPTRRIQEAIQGASQAKARPRGNPTRSLGPSYARRGQGPPHRGLQGGLYSRHCAQRRELDNVRESSEPDNVRNLLSRCADDVPKKGPRFDSPQARPSALLAPEPAGRTAITITWIPRAGTTQWRRRTAGSWRPAPPWRTCFPGPIAGCFPLICQPFLEVRNTSLRR